MEWMTLDEYLKQFRGVEMSIGLIKEGDDLPNNTRVLTSVYLFNQEWLKIEGPNVSDKSNNMWQQFNNRNIKQQSKMYISSIDLINLLPDETIPEIEDIANNVSGSATKKARGKAYKILKFLGHPKPLNLKSDTFGVTARWLVSNSDIPSFKQTTLNAIYTELGLL